MFYNSNINVFGTPIPTIPFLGNIAATYQAYMTSHARSADPNTFSRTVNLPAYEAIQWPMVSAAGDALAGVLDVGDFGLSVIVDTQAKRGACAFWEDVAAAVTGGGGYAVCFFSSFLLSPFFLVVFSSFSFLPLFLLVFSSFFLSSLQFLPVPLFLPFLPPRLQQSNSSMPA